MPGVGFPLTFGIFDGSGAISTRQEGNPAPPSIRTAERIEAQSLLCWPAPAIAVEHR